MATCGEKHPEHAVPCEAEEGPGGSRHVGRHYSTYPYREWGEFVAAPMCGAAHPKHGWACTRSVHQESADDPSAAWHSHHFGGGHRVSWQEGREDRWTVPESKAEARERAEAAERGRQAWIDGEDLSKGWRFDTERWR